MMSSWNNQSIIKFLGIGAKFTLIMEYAPYGSLDRYLRLNYPTVNQNHFISMAVQLVDGLEYLVGILRDEKNTEFILIQAETKN